MVYVDDIIIASSQVTVVDTLFGRLSCAFAAKDLESLHYFLGVEATSHAGGLVLTQQKYISDLLKRANMQLCKHVDTPMSNSENLSREQ